MSTTTAAATGDGVGLAGVQPVVPVEDMPPPERPKRIGWSDVVGPLIVFVVFLLAWEYMHRDGMQRLFGKPGFLVPSPVSVVDQFLNSPGHIIRKRLITGLGWTSLVAAIGLTITIVVGVGWAVLMSRARWVERAFFPYMVALQATPVLAIVPLIGSIIGFELNSRVFVCVMISFFPVVTNTLFGLTSVDQSQHDLFTLRSASRMTRLRKLQFPAAMPAMFTGFRTSAGLSVIGAIVGEQFFQQGSKPGIGIAIEQFRQKGVMEGTYAGLILIALLGIAIFILFGWLGRLVVGHWYEANRS